MVISKRPILCEGLKRLIEQKLFCTVATAPSEEIGALSLVELEPDVVIVDRPDVRAKDLDYLFQRQERPTSIAVIGWEDDTIAVYSRRVVPGATLENLMKFIIAESGARLRGIETLNT